MADKFKEIKVPNTRRALVDVLELGLKNHYTPAFTEIDVTLARQLIKERKKSDSNKISFLSWMIKCIADSISENKEVHALQHKKNKMVLFDDVDVSVIIERKIPGAADNIQHITLPYIIRRANEKTVPEIFNEIRTAQSEAISKDDVRLGPGKDTRESKIFLSLPKFLRNIIFWNKLNRDAFLVKKKVGTVLVSSVGMFTRHNDYIWGVSRSIQPLSILFTGLIKKPAVVDGQIVIREFLCTTFGFQHDLLDGAPFTRYVTKLKKMIESAEGL
jgi:pyruvate/2-oxoglutarate dehydrogenase complex dihydrolipoamide acyltransferase (E2) component